MTELANERTPAKQAKDDVQRERVYHCREKSKSCWVCELPHSYIRLHTCMGPGCPLGPRQANPFAVITLESLLLAFGFA